MSSKAFLKLKKDIEELPDFDRGFYISFWLGYIHGICDYPKYGELTEKEAVRLENICVRKRKRCQTKSR